MTAGRRLSRGKGQLEAAGKMWALENAMRTINNAYRGSGKGATRFCPATNLVPASPDVLSPLKPSFEFASKAADHYEGYFHTDHLIPGVYFEPKQPHAAPPRYNDLTFRYIYDGAADPQEHAELMTGIDATWYDVRRNMDRIPDFANPENGTAFTEKTRARLADWLEKRLRERLIRSRVIPDIGRHSWRAEYVKPQIRLGGGFGLQCL